MKRILSMVIIFILALFMLLPFSAYADYEIPRFVRIGLFYGTGAVKTIELSCDYGFEIGEYNDREFYFEDETDATNLTVTFENGYAVVREYNDRVIFEGDYSVGLKPRASGMNQRMKIGDVEYRGAVDCIVEDNGLAIINVVFLDHYLYGVISREMSPSWHQQALKAQAVCARNYAINSLNKHSDHNFDLCASVHCQAYSGTKAETDKSYAPVDDTTRQILTYDNNLAQLYYSASMGKRTEDVKNVWGNKVPYLISVDNRFEDTEHIPNGVWQGTLSKEEASTIMRNKGYNVGDVTDIEVLEYTDNGRVLKMEVTGTEGSKVFERESCRTIFNTVTKSQAFTVGKAGDSVQSIPKVFVTDGKNVSKSNIKELTLLTSDGRVTLDDDVLYTTNGVYQQAYEVSEKESYTGSDFYFEGEGWGHGVGMSQYGAKGMAEAGYSYLDILQHYFPGTNLENAY